jgi:hypothetical protein
MIDIDTAQIFRNEGNNKASIALALLLAEFEGTELLSLAVLKHPEVQEQYARISKICDAERTKQVVEKKFNTFLKTLTVEELETLKSVKVPQW